MLFPFLVLRGAKNGFDLWVSLRCMAFSCFFFSLPGIDGLSLIAFSLGASASRIGAGTRFSCWAEVKYLGRVSPSFYSEAAHLELHRPPAPPPRAALQA